MCLHMAQFKRNLEPMFVLIAGKIYLCYSCLMIPSLEPVSTVSSSRVRSVSTEWGWPDDDENNKPTRQHE